MNQTQIRNTISANPHQNRWMDTRRKITQSNKISKTPRYDPHSEAPQKSWGAYEDVRAPEASISLSDPQTATSVSGINNSQVQTVCSTIPVPENAISCTIRLHARTDR